MTPAKREKLLNIGNPSFIYPFEVLGGKEVDVIIDPRYVLSYIRAHMPELEIQSPETSLQIKEMASESGAPDELFSDRPDFTVMQAIITRLMIGVPYPIKYAPPIRVFYGTLKDAMGAPEGVQCAELFAVLLECYKAIGEAEALKKNGQTSLSSPASTASVEPESKNSTEKPCTGCGSTSDPSKPVKALSLL